MMMFDSVYISCSGIEGKYVFGSNSLKLLKAFTKMGMAGMVIIEKNYRKFLKFGTPQATAIIVLKVEKFDVTLH